MLDQILAIIISLYGIFFGVSGNIDTPAESGTTVGTTTAKVLSVIDGDTIEVEMVDGSGRYRVRYIGIDTPEPYSKGEPECGSAAATSRNRALVEDRLVDLHFDIESTDQYGRKLAYVYIDDVFVNQTLVTEGFAEVMMFPPNTKYKKEFLALYSEAKSEERGIWSMCSK